MATWDAGLPQAPMVNGFTETNPDTLIRTQMDAGADKVRRRTTAGVRDFKMQFLMSKAQTVIFDTFYNTTTNGGADKFTFTHPRTGVSSANWRFKGQPNYSSTNGEYFTVAVEMELLP